MQPDTTALKLAKDIAAMLSGDAPSEQLQNSGNQESEPANSQPKSDTPPSAKTSESQVQVVPLYNPSSSAIKFFCVHPSHRYAMNLVPISTGFQGQVISNNSIHVMSLILMSSCTIGWLQRVKRLHLLVNKITFVWKDINAFSKMGTNRNGCAPLCNSFYV